VAIVEAERQDTYVIKQLKTQVIQRVYWSEMRMKAILRNRSF
jgi:hypothetical protein